MISQSSTQTATSNTNTDISQSPTPPEGDTKKKKLVPRAVIRNAIMLVIFLGIIGGVGYIASEQFMPQLKTPSWLKSKNGTNATNTPQVNTTINMVQRSLPKVVLPLWDSEDDSSSITPDDKAECQMGRKNQCYTGHRCYKRKCVPWCRNDDDCWPGHTCLRKEKGTNWRLCSLSPEFQFPCRENYKYCRKNGDCCTGSCELRGKWMVCVPPEKFERKSSIVGRHMEEVEEDTNQEDIVVE